MRNHAKENAPKSSERDNGTSASTSLHSRSFRVQIILANAQLNILDYNGEYKTCRAVLDSGSQVSFVSESAVTITYWSIIISKMNW